MNTDTPETDSAYRQRLNEGAWDFRVRQEKTMEKLERERDEAREQRDMLAKALKEIEWSYDSQWQADRARAAIQSLTPKP
jgi:hypothetical protein